MVLSVWIKGRKSITRLKMIGLKLPGLDGIVWCGSRTRILGKILFREGIVGKMFIREPIHTNKHVNSCRLALGLGLIGGSATLFQNNKNQRNDKKNLIYINRSYI